MQTPVSLVLLAAGLVPGLLACENQNLLGTNDGAGVTEPGGEDPGGEGGEGGAAGAAGHEPLGAGEWGDVVVEVPMSCGAPSDIVVALGASGNVYVAWFQLVDEVSLLHVARLDGRSETWTTPSILNPDAEAGVSSSGAALAVDARGNALVVWEQGEFAEDSSLAYAVRSARWLSEADEPEPWMRLSSDVRELARFPTLALLPSGAAIVGYLNQSASRMETVAFDGVSWSAPRIVPPGPEPATTALGVATTDAGVALALQSYDGGAVTGAACPASLASWTLDETWPSGVRVGPADTCAEFSAVGLDSVGHGFVLSAEPSGELYAQRFDDELGASTSLRSGAVVVQGSARLSVANAGPAAATWLEGGDVWAALAPEGEFEAATPVEAMAGAALSPQIVTDDFASALAVWRQSQLAPNTVGDEPHLWSALREGDTWVSPMRLDAEDENAVEQLALARGVSGGAVVAFEQGGCLRIRVFR